MSKIRKIDWSLVFRRFGNWAYPIIKCDGTTEFGWRVFKQENMRLGKNTDIAFGVLINASEGVEIGDYVQIGPYASLLSTSTIPCKVMKGKITIGEGAMIGAYSLVMPGVTIGRGSFIPAHSYVSHDVPEMVIYRKDGNHDKIEYTLIPE